MMQANTVAARLVAAARTTANVDRPTGFLWIVLCIGLAEVVGSAILLAPYPPMQDFIEWAYQGHVLARMLEGLPVGDVQLATTPIPNSTVQAILGLLSLVMPAAMAAQAFLLGLVVASLSLAFALGRRWQPEVPGAFAALLLVAVFFNAAFWNGYANYQLGMVILGGWFLLPEARRRTTGAIMAASLLLFFTHAMVFAAFGAIVGMEALLAGRLRPVVLGMLPAAGFAAWYVTVDAGGGTTDAGATGGAAGFLAYKLYTIAKLGPYHNFVFETGGDAIARPMMYWGGTALNVVFAAGLLATLGMGLWVAIRRRRLPLAPVAAAMVLLGLFAVLPNLVQNVVNPGERLLVPALLVLLLVLPLPAPLVRGLGLGAVALAANLLLLTLPQHEWEVPVHFTALQDGGAGGLFRHRPTAFACKWHEMRRSHDEGDAPRQPLSFRTSLLLGRTVDGCGSNAWPEPQHHVWNHGAVPGQ